MDLVQRAAAKRAEWSSRPNAPTAKGTAVIALAQIRRAMLDMGPADRDEVMDMVAGLIAARRRVSGAGEMLDGDYCIRHAALAVEWWRDGIKVSI